MDYLLLGAVPICTAINMVALKQFTLKNTHPAAPSVFNLEMAGTMLIGFWILNGGRYAWHLPTILYALVFALGFTLFAQYSLQAVASGPLGISNLLINYSLLLPTLAGVLFWQEKVSAGLIFGLILLLISLALLNARSGDTDKSFSWKWLLYVLLAFLGNGACSISQKMHQQTYPEQYRCEFMMTAMLITMLFCLLRFIPVQKQGLAKSLRSGVQWAIVYGVGNTIVNFLVMVLCIRMNASILFPTIAAGGILLNLLIALTVYRERLNRFQVAAFLTGVGSVILLNL